MFINKTREGCNNICGDAIARMRKEARLSQNKLATQLQLQGLSIDKNAVQRIEAGKRFVTDIELYYFALLFHVPLEQLLDADKLPGQKNRL